MQRPVMNPLFADDAPGPPRGRFPRLRWVLRLLVRVLLSDPLGGRGQPKLRVEVGTPASRFVRGLMYRLAFVPILLVLVVGALVFTGTHPPHIATRADPASQGVYYDPVTFLSADGVRLEAWLVPVLDAKRVLEEKEQALRKKHPAVVLAHDYGGTRQQMLPLVRPLHDAGLVVLAISLRGNENTGRVGQTFGLNESLDVEAAVEMLRRRPYIDPKRIAVLGTGTGASAALLAAQRDPTIAAVVLEDPVRSSVDVIASHIGPTQNWLSWMRPLCKWTFEASYGVDADELNFNRFPASIASRPMLMLDAHSRKTGLHPHTIEQIGFFLGRHLVRDETVAHVERAE